MGAIVLELLTGGWNLIKMGLAALGKFLGSLNGQGWIGLIVAALLGWTSLHFWGEERHWSKQDRHDVKALHVLQASDARLAAQNQALKSKADAQSVTISAKNKELDDAQNARIDADANAARVRGPGKAVCPGLPASPGGSSQALAAVSNAGPEVPSGNWAAVPWDWLVSVVEEHDQLLTEDQTWRQNDKQQRDAWPKSDGAIQAK